MVKQSEQIVFRIEPQTRKLLIAAARQSGDTLSNWARATLAATARKMLTSPADWRQVELKEPGR